MLWYVSHTTGEIRRIPLDSNRYVIHADRIELQLDHFSWGILTMVYNWLFPATKRMLCTPFVPETLPENQDCPTLRVRFYDQLPGLPEVNCHVCSSPQYQEVEICYVCALWKKRFINNSKIIIMMIIIIAVFYYCYTYIHRTLMVMYYHFKY